MPDRKATSFRSFRPAGQAMSSATTKARPRSRATEWWVADEEPEIYSARGDGLDSMIPRASPGRVAVVLLLAIAAGVGGALLF
jgi:hypothetical protein